MIQTHLRPKLSKVNFRNSFTYFFAQRSGFDNELVARHFERLCFNRIFLEDAAHVKFDEDVLDFFRVLLREGAVIVNRLLEGRAIFVV